MPRASVRRVPSRFSTAHHFLAIQKSTPIHQSTAHKEMDSTFFIGWWIGGSVDTCVLAMGNGTWKPPPRSPPQATCTSSEAKFRQFPRLGTWLAGAAVSWKTALASSEGHFPTHVITVPDRKSNCLRVPRGYRALLALCRQRARSAHVSLVCKHVREHVGLHRAPGVFLASLGRVVHTL